MFRDVDAIALPTLNHLCAHLPMLVVRCEKDGSVVKAVRKLCRDFKVSTAVL